MNPRLEPNLVLMVVMVVMVVPGSLQDSGDMLDEESSRVEALANGANDVIVVRRASGELQSTAWQGQIGKLNSVFQSREGRDVAIFVGSVPARQMMTVTQSGSLKFKEGSPHSMSSEDLEELNLKVGVNPAKYVCVQLDEVIEFNIFLYSEKDKIVITDFDGTITESDLRGHISSFLGTTNQHKGVVELFDRVHRRGYKLVYLTARSMAQVEETKKYIFRSLQNQQGYSLPMGPVLFNPVTFISGLVTEVVTKAPHVQKIKTIRDLWATFESDNRTDINGVIKAAYGNTDTDTKAYLEAGLRPGSVFIVNKQGVLKNIGTGDVSSYEMQIENIEKLYPQINVEIR